MDGAWDANMSRAPGMFFFWISFYFTNIYLQSTATTTHTHHMPPCHPIILHHHNEHRPHSKCHHITHPHPSPPQDARHVTDPRKHKKGSSRLPFFLCQVCPCPLHCLFFTPNTCTNGVCMFDWFLMFNFLYRSSRDTLTIHFNPQLRISNSHSRVSTPNQGIATMRGRVYKVHLQNLLFLFVYWLLQQYHDPRTCHHVCIIPHNRSQTNATYAIKTLGHTLCTPLIRWFCVWARMHKTGRISLLGK